MQMAEHTIGHGTPYATGQPCCVIEYTEHSKVIDIINQEIGTAWLDVRCTKWT